MNEIGLEGAGCWGRWSATVVALLVAGAAAAGCASSGQAFDVNAARSIDVGMDKPAVIARLGGPPGDVSPLKEGSPLKAAGCKELLTWSFAEYTGGVMYTKAVSVPFGDGEQVCSKPAVIDVNSK